MYHTTSPSNGAREERAQVEHLPEDQNPGLQPTSEHGPPYSRGLLQNLTFQIGWGSRTERYIQTDVYKIRKEECLKIREALRNSSTESDIHWLLSLHWAPVSSHECLIDLPELQPFASREWTVELEESCLHRWDIIRALLGVKKCHPLGSCPISTRLYCLIVKVDIWCLSFTLGKLLSQ